MGCKVKKIWQWSQIRLKHLFFCCCFLMIHLSHVLLEREALNNSALEWLGLPMPKNVRDLDWKQAQHQGWIESVQDWQSCLKMCGFFFFSKCFPEMEQLNLVALQDYLIVRMLRHWFIKPKLLTRKGHRCLLVHKITISPDLGLKLLWISHIFNNLCLSRNLPKKNNETTTQENHIHYHLCLSRI